MGINDLRHRIAGRKIAVLGLGISNFPLIEFFHKMGAGKIVGFDRSDSCELKKRLDELALRIPFEYYLGEDYLSYLTDDFDEIYKTPVLRPDIPELARARERGAYVTSEMEEFLKHCPAKTYAVTGSDGKTTTTTILYLLLKEAFKDKETRVWLGGNIGKPVLPHLEEIDKEDRVVLELSSFQLLTMTKSPDVSVVTNVSPNHLDVHKSYEEYIEAKKNIYRFQNGEGVVVLNSGNDVTLAMMNEVLGKTRAFGFGIGTWDGAYSLDGKLYTKVNGEITEIMDTKDVLLPGNHNLENYMAAISAVCDVVSAKDIYNVATSFKGVEHRLEFVRELKGVKYFNSSIDSSPNRTMNALNVFKDKEVVLIAGGADKKIPFDSLGKALFEKVRVLILTGPTAKLIENAARDEYRRRGKEYDIVTYHCQNYEEAVECACKEAKSGEVVLLSPASTSFDMFKNFEERGKTFKYLVNKLTV
ncbi:MAG TPA: UDP-N-acetylmuramoyl-L-alanine--D-glutamate ligase [Clostridia bacterium]|nr:UDP-N-acetylmuramoyl-L-alanine--D-glutamate ligase [Clostridia bacterium]